MKTAGVLAFLAVAAVGGWFGYNAYFDDAASSPFLTRKLDRGDIVRTVTATGTIEPVVKVIVGSQVSGNIKKWYADFNDEVTEGEVLAEINPDRFQTNFDQAKANLALAQAREEELLVRAEDAKRERRRLESLRELNTATDNEYQIAKATEAASIAAWHGAQAGVQAAEATLSAAKVDLDRTIIRSPINGVVISRTIEDGQTVAASLQAPELFIIANDLRRMKVNANVSESDIGRVKQGAPARFRVDAYPERTFTGTISQVRFNGTDVEGVVTYVTLIEVDNEDLALRPGMTANVTFEVAKAENVVRIPNQALRFDPNASDDATMGGRPSSRRSKPTVYVQEGGGPAPREVEIGLSDGTMTELKSGELTEGDEVILERNWAAEGGRRPDPTRSMRRGGRF